MKFLIINADDLGRSLQINRAIIKSFLDGVVTSASVMTNWPASPNAVQMARDQDLPVGIHFNLTEGVPISDPIKIPSLVNQQGKFFQKVEFFVRLLRKRIRQRDIETELRAQVDHCRILKLDHYDSHHHVHVLTGVKECCQRIAHDYHIPHCREITQPHPAQSLKARMQQWTIHLMGRGCAMNTPGRRFWGFEFMMNKNKLQVLQKTVSVLDNGLHELMCHPGYPGENVGAYSEPRHKELLALCDEGLPSMLREYRVNPVSYRDFDVECTHE